LAKYANICHTAAMATLNISLTDSMRAYVDERIASGRYGSASEYFRELIRAEQDRSKREELEQKLLEGVRSGEAKPLTKADFDRIRAYARELATQKPTRKRG